MFASEYLVASFEDVREVLEGLTDPLPRLRVTHGVRASSSSVASLGIECSDGSSPARWHEAELRIICVQSGSSPLTEMLLVAPSLDGAADARVCLGILAERVEAGLAVGSSTPARP